MENKKEEVNAQHKERTQDEMKAIITVKGKIFPFPLTMEQLANYREACEKEEKSKLDNLESETLIDDNK